MSININESIVTENAHLLRFVSVGNGSVSSSSVNAAERFLRSASVLSQGGSLTLQIHARKDSESTAYILSGPGTQIATQDIDWIFNGCAETASPDVSFEDCIDDSTRVYSVISDIEQPSDPLTSRRTYYYDDYDDSLCSDHFKEMFTLLEQEGAMIRITAEASDRSEHVTGSLTIILPGEMPLRLRSASAIALPHTHIVEIREGDDKNVQNESISNHSLLSFTESLLYLLSKRHIEATEIIPETGPLVVSPEEETLDVLIPCEANDPIDQLGLSIRSYNCLKRAGIDTVEQLAALSDSDLASVRNLGKKSLEEIRSKLRHIPSVSEKIDPEYPDHFAMLDSLIGLHTVKEQIKKITAYARLRQEMLQAGKKGPVLSLNMEFTGNPGTAKTTVARITAGILHDLGILPSDSIVEVGRSDLVARYEGQTASKVRDVFLEAKGKVLFIDEAYSLLENHQGEYGDEAINTIVQEMENSRSDTVVIFAGYPDRMEAFFSRNPGFRSRVPFRIEFSDYSARELVSIAGLEAEKQGFSISPDAYMKLTAVCSQAAGRPELGNGRFCRNIIENAVLNYASRIFCSGNDDISNDFILTAEDIVSPAPDVTPDKAIGFAC